MGLLLGRVKPLIPPAGSNPRGEAKLGGWLLEKSTGSVCTLPYVRGSLSVYRSLCTFAYSWTSEHPYRGLLFLAGRALPGSAFTGPASSSPSGAEANVWAVFRAEEKKNNFDTEKSSSICFVCILHIQTAFPRKNPQTFKELLVKLKESFLEYSIFV